MTTEYIDITPNWEQSGRMLAHALACGMTPDGTRDTIAMLAEIGRMVDHAQEKHPGIFAEFERVHI